MSEKKWYEQYFGEGTIEYDRAYLDSKGRLFLLLDDIEAEQSEHSCDQMGCGSVGPHIGKVFVDAEKYDALRSQLAEKERELADLRREVGEADLALLAEKAQLRRELAAARAGLCATCKGNPQTCGILSVTSVITECAGYKKEGE